MTLFESVKAAVTPKQAAERYGLSVNRSVMTRCPFHDDHTPSMKLNDDYFYCFGCGSKGDVIDLTAKFFDLPALDAAKKLAAEFGITEVRPSVLAMLKQGKTQLDNERLCFRVLSDYLHILQDWKSRYVPQTPEDTPHPRFVEACHMLDCTEYIRRGAYGRENTPYAPRLCPADGGQAVLRQGYCRQQEKADLVAG